MTHPENTTPANPAQGTDADSDLLSQCYIAMRDAMSVIDVNEGPCLKHSKILNALADARVKIERRTERQPVAAISMASLSNPAQGVSAQDPLMILAGIKQFGLAPDGSDLRDLEAAIERLAAIGAGGQAVAGQHVAYFDDGESHWMSGIAPRNCELYANPPAQPGWRDMSSAPKDGTRILLSIGYKTVLARWYDPWSNWQCGDIPADPAREEYHGIGSLVPNGWMPAPIPLPASPQPGDA